ncbi:antirestriction family protein [Burkholderia gladioli]|uniref:Antirestriction family protein n=1 Tax=Burkholderia gladioli TaxID=28095 RepID=A0AAW3FCD4_BURGA|nr:antirestriction protein [Burkholderia gladioli]KGC20247.1 antirestriction family protein [Burkholderia gladioli]
MPPTHQTDVLCIDGNLIPDSVNAPPSLFGQHYLLGEGLTLGLASMWSPNVYDHVWDTFSIGNGSAYHAPRSDDPFHLQIDSNGYTGVMSADAFGIVVTMTVLRFLVNEKRSLKASIHYNALRSYAGTHPEAQEIFQALD